jgi:REP-associated tyrosine transposase
MPTPRKYKAPLFAEMQYHLIFRTVDGVPLFREPCNKVFFRRRYKHYLNPMLSTLAINLMENHAHFIVKIKSIKDLKKSISKIPEEKRTKRMKEFLVAEDPALLVNAMILRQINSFLVSYAMSYNILYNRKGGMFHSPCRRVVVKDAKHLKHGIVYVNANAQKHHLVDDFRTYPDTSYHDVLANSSSIISIKPVLDFFGGREEFIKSHEQIVAFYYSTGWQFDTLSP